MKKEKERKERGRRIRRNRVIEGDSQIVVNISF